MTTTAAESGASSLANPTASANGLGLCFPDGTHVLRDTSFTIGINEFVAVVGPSGCGKSTLLRVMSGLLQPTSGSCSTYNQEVGFVFQDSTLLPWRTALQNVELFLQLQGVPKAQRRLQAKEALHAVGLHDSQDKYPRHLSGGMKMRVSLARSLVGKPSLYLFDEPFAALDEFTRESLNDDLLSLFSAQRFSALFVTHSIAEAVYLSNRVMIMSLRPGSIAQVIQVPLPFPRRAEMRYTAQFAQCCGEIAAHLRELQLK